MKHKNAELNIILEDHKKWLLDHSLGKRADLSDANLSHADLRWADLRWADLSGANLRWADLRWADLRRADLSGADLRYLIGNGMEVKTIQTDMWVITYTDEKMAIGCQQHTLEEWFGFSEKQIKDMEEEEAIEFWTKWKPILEAIGVFEELEK